MKHSPAPWRIGNKQERAVLDANGSQIAVLPESLKDDAALIASSPDLLEACKMALLFIDLCGPGGDGTKSALRILNRAIAKAEGMPYLTVIDDNVPHTDDFVQKMIDHVSKSKGNG